MLNGLKTLNEWLGTITELLKSLVVVGIVVGILFDDFFGVIADQVVLCLSLAMQVSQGS